MSDSETARSNPAKHSPKCAITAGLNQLLQLSADHLSDIGFFISAAAVMVLAVLVVIEVLLRQFFNTSTLVSTEMSGYLLVVNVFLGLAWTFRTDGFIRVDLLYGKFSKRTRQLADLVIAIVSLIVMIVVTFYLWSFALDNLETGNTSVFITRTPLWIPQISMPIGATMLLIAMAAEIARAAAALRRPFHPSAPPEPESTLAKRRAGDWL